MTSFQERQKSLFNELKNAEEQCSFSTSNKATPPRDYGTIDKHTYRRLKHEMRQFRGKESIYKRKDANIKECLRAKSIPGYVKNPQNWVYYSLSDVTPEQMSDATNTATALALIRELEEKEETISKMEQEPDDSVFKKPTFHYSSSIKKVPVDEKVVFKSNKIIMPEYVVGVTKKKEKKNCLSKDPIKDDHGSAKKPELKLDHLYEEE